MSLIMRLYIGGGSSRGALDLATCVYNSDVTAVDNTDTGGGGCTFNTDGSEAWVLGNNNISMRGFTLSTPYIFPGGTGVPNSNTASLGTSPAGLKFSENGLYLFIQGAPSEIYTLSTPFLLSTAVLSSSNVALNTAQSSTISRDGLRIYLITGGLIIKRYDLLAPWDLVGAVDSGFDSEPLEVGNNFGIAVSNDETRFYITGTNAAPFLRIREYIMSTPERPDTIPATPDPGAVLIPNYELSIAGPMSATVDISVAYDMQHVLISGANATPGEIRAFTLTGDTV